VNDSLKTLFKKLITDATAARGLVDDAGLSALAAARLLVDLERINKRVDKARTLLQHPTQANGHPP
jgi:hypothetical protein